MICSNLYAAENMIWRTNSPIHLWKLISPTVFERIDTPMKTFHIEASSTFDVLTRGSRGIFEKWQISRLGSPSLHQKLAKSRIKVRLLHERFETYVHAVTPKMSGICRFVDALSRHIGQTKALIYGQPILPGKNTQHRRAIHVPTHDFFTQPSRRIRGRFAAVSEHLEEVT